MPASNFTKLAFSDRDPQKEEGKTKPSDFSRVAFKGVNIEQRFPSLSDSLKSGEALEKDTDLSVSRSTKAIPSERERGIGAKDFGRFAREVARGFAAGGAAIAGVPAQVKALVTNRKGPGVGELEPTGKFQKTVFGEEPVSLATEGSDITFGFVPQESIVAPVIGAGFSFLDLSTGGAASKSVRIATKSLKGASKTDEALNILKNTGVADDIAQREADLFVRLSDEKDIQKNLQRIQDEQNVRVATEAGSTIARTSDESVVRETLESTGISSSRAKELAPDLAKRTDPEDIAREIAPESVKRFTDTGARLSDATPVRATDETAQAGRAVDEIPPQLAEEARKFDSAEEFVKKADIGKESLGRFQLEKTFDVKGNKFSDFALDNQGRLGKLTLEESKNGFRIRNVFVDESLQGQGIAKNAYRKANLISIQETGKPLRSSTLFGKGGKKEVTSLNESGARLWESLVKTGEAELVDGKFYRMKQSQLTDFFNRVKGGDEVARGADEARETFRQKGKITTQKNIDGVNVESVDPKALPQKERGFARTIINSPETTPELRRGLMETKYTPTTNRAVEDAARKRVTDSKEQAENFALGSKDPGAEETATAIELIKRFQDEGNTEGAVRVADTLATRLTKAGQEIQAAKLYSNLSQEGLIIRAQKLVRETNQKKLRFQDDITLTDDFVENLRDLHKQKSEATDPELVAELNAEIGRQMTLLKRISFLEKVSATQTIVQLLNPKTWIRNIIGNEIFYRTERLNKYVATPIDWARSKLTGGERTVTFRSAKDGGFWAGFLRGARMGWKGQEPIGLPTQFDLPSQTFRSAKNPLYWGEKILGAGLRGFDVAGYIRGKNKAIGELAFLRATNEGLRGSKRMARAKEIAKNADENMTDIAHKYGRYVTFQDDNVISLFFQKTKRTMNKLTGSPHFGLGDLALKYPRTPGALLMRGIEYSPAGFIRSAFIAAKPWLKGKKPSTKEITESLSRAITGTLGMTGLGYYFRDVGILTADGPEDRELSVFQRSLGTGPYRVNVSALQRWVESGFDENETTLQQGDIMVSYDWAQPVSLAFAIGSNANSNIQEDQNATVGLATNAIQSLEGGVNTLAEQPLVTGLVNMFGAGGTPSERIGRGVIRTALDLPSSFTPTLLNQFRQWMDNTRRNAYDPGQIAQSINYAKRKIPGLANNLPPLVDQFGRDAEAFQGNSNNIFNVFFNPSFVTRYTTDKEAQLVIDLFESIGATKQVPRIAPDKITVRGERVALSPQQKTAMQRLMGEETLKAFSDMVESDAFMDLSDEEKAEFMSDTMSDISEQAQDFIFGTHKFDKGTTYKDELQFLDIIRMVEQGDRPEAEQIIRTMSEEEWQAYKSVRSSWRSKNTRALNKLLDKSPTDAVLFLRSQIPEEQERLLEGMTDEEYEIYSENKPPASFYASNKSSERIETAARGEVLELKEKGETTEKELKSKVEKFAEAAGVDMITAFESLFSKEDVIRKVEGDTIIFERMPTAESQAIRVNKGVRFDNSDYYRLDHRIPLQLGGSNNISNLELISKTEHDERTRVGNHLGRQVRSGTMSGERAREIMLDFLEGDITEQEAITF